MTVAIISILLAILLPSLRMARERAKRMTCASNLGQIGKAWHLYLIDNGERFPIRSLNANINYGGRQGNGSPVFQVPKPLNRYLHLESTTLKAAPFLCPCDSGISSFKPSCAEYAGTSYNVNNILVGPAQLLALATDPCNQPPNSLLAKLNFRLSNLPKDANGYQSLRLSQITASHSLVALAGDFGWWNAYYFTTDQDMAEWHNNRSSYNLGFVDGHVEFVKVRKGMQVTSRYTVIPFKEFLALAESMQKEVKH